MVIWIITICICIRISVCTKIVLLDLRDLCFIRYSGNVDNKTFK